MQHFQTTDCGNEKERKGAWSGVIITAPYSAFLKRPLFPLKVEMNVDALALAAPGPGVGLALFFRSKLVAGYRFGYMGHRRP